MDGLRLGLRMSVKGCICGVVRSWAPMITNKDNWDQYMSSMPSIARSIYYSHELVHKSLSPKFNRL